MSTDLHQSALTSHVGFWMRLVSNHVSHAFARKLENTGVTVAEWVVLREMMRTGRVTTPGTVADTTGLTRGAISKLVNRLSEKGLVMRVEALNDRRFQEISLTDKALELIPKLVAIADENDDAAFSVLTDEERGSLQNILHKLARLHQLTTMPID